MVQAVSFNNPRRGQRAHATMRGILPPKFDGPVTVYPQTVFRPETIETKASAGVHMFVDGMAVKLDGRVHALAKTEARALCVGSFICAHLVNDLDVDAPFELVFRGTTVDLTGEIASGSRLGVRLAPIAEPDDAPPAASSPDGDEGTEGPDADGATTDDDEPASARSVDIGRAALLGTMGAIFSSVVAPAVLDLFWPKDEPPAADGLSLDEDPKQQQIDDLRDELNDLKFGKAPHAPKDVYVTELKGPGAVPRPEGDGWQLDRVYAVANDGVRAVWVRCAGCWPAKAPENDAVAVAS